VRRRYNALAPPSAYRRVTASTIAHLAAFVDFDNTIVDFDNSVASKLPRAPGKAGWTARLVGSPAADAADACQTVFASARLETGTRG